MKYVISLVLGLLVGAALFAAGLLFNPFIADRGLSPLSVSQSEVIALNFANVPAESIAYTNNGESLQPPHPEKVLQLWEAPIRMTSAMITVMHDARNRVAGIGVKFMSDSESTRLLHGDMIVDSVWYIYLPEHGSLFVEQTENYFPFVREIVFPAWRSSANSWRGSWRGDLSAGPGALGTARVIGGSGRVDGFRMDGVESMTVQAFSLEMGLVAAEGSLLIEMPASTVAQDVANDTL
jgi:Tfp pilus assembly protein PilZ